MSEEPRLEEQIAMAGYTYGRRHDISYRIGLVAQVLGAALLAVLYPPGNPFYTTGIIVFEAGVLLSAVYLLVWMRSVKTFILIMVIIGLAIQAFGPVFAAGRSSGPVMIAGIGFVCIGASGIVGKEAYCFGYREGWGLVIMFPIMVLVNLLGGANIIFNSIGFSILFLLLLSLTGKKLRQRLLSPCSKNVCEAPKKDRISDRPDTG